MPTLGTPEDKRWMRAALSLSRRGLGTTSPNPSVGCILVKNGKVVGRGWTQPGGRPHAERVALDMAAERARGSTAYVTLEPCAHIGETPPCAEALISAGVTRVVVATQDTDSRVSGEGCSRLKNAGIEVIEDVMQLEAQASNAGFLSRISENRPYVTVKTATSLDGKIALSNGESQWITGTRARQHGHILRAQSDAILTGVGTVLTDDPALTCRIDGCSHRSPRRVVMDRHFRTPETARLLCDENAANTLILTEKKEAPLWFTHSRADFQAIDDLSAMADVLTELSKRGINNLLVEAGAKLTASFIKSGLVDEVCHYVAGHVIGADGLGAIAELGLGKIAEMPHFMISETRQLGPDVLIRARATRD